MSLFWLAVGWRKPKVTFAGDQSRARLDDTVNEGVRREVKSDSGHIGRLDCQRHLWLLRRECEHVPNRNILREHHSSGTGHRPVRKSG